jgi:hypothetical protein
MSDSSAKAQKLPPWFGQEAYAWVEQLSVDMLLTVLLDRLLVCEAAFASKDEEWAQKTVSDFCSVIRSEPPHFYNKHLRELEESPWPEKVNNLNDRSLISGSTAYPIGSQVAWAALRRRWLREPELIKDKTSVSPSNSMFSINGLVLCSDFDISISEDDGSVWLKLDIEQNSDDDIISDLKKMLPLWREKLKQPGPERQNKIGVGIIASIISFKIIPMMDLFIWEAVAGVKLTNAERLEALQPAADAGSLMVDLDSFRKTHLALFDKLYTSANYAKYGGGNFIERLIAWSIRIHPKLGAAPAAYKVHDLLVLLGAKA